jgi:hypothetical protein
VKTLCKTLEELKLVTISDKGILLNSFSERNFDSDNSTLRVQKYREKQKQSKNDETAMKRFGNVSETPQNRTDTEHINNTPPTPKKGVSRKAKENGIPYDKIRELWNQFKPPLLPMTIAINATRKNLIKQAWIEHPSLAWFQQFFKDINLSDHHSGRNDKNWTPEIEWILKNRLKLQEKIAAVKVNRNGYPQKPTHDPKCPRCHGSGLYQSGKGQDHQPIMSKCDCEVLNGEATG